MAKVMIVGDTTFGHRPKASGSGEQRAEQEPTATRPSPAKASKDAFTIKAKGRCPKTASQSRRRPQEAGHEEHLSEATQVASAGATRT